MAAKKKKAARTRVRGHDVMTKFLDTSQGRSQCQTCMLSDSTHEAIALYLTSVHDARKAGRIPRSLKGFTVLLRQHYDYPFQSDALTHHMRRCLHAEPV